MDDLPGNMTKRRDRGKHLWHGETACPHAAGTGRTRGAPAEIVEKLNKESIADGGMKASLPPSAAIRCRAHRSLSAS
jgi:hypothetical protein